MKIIVAIKNNHLRINIDGLLHLSVKANEIKAVKTYLSEGYYHIDYHLADTIVETTYKVAKTWANILRQLEKINII